MNRELLETSRFPRAAALPPRAQVGEDELVSGDPALRALTDFRREYPITVARDRPIDEALTDMIRFGVRALLVTDTDGALPSTPIAGLVTSYDIQGERPLQVLGSAREGRHTDVRVGDVMTAWEDLSVLAYDALHTMTVGEIRETFQGTGLTHLLVVEMNGTTTGVIRGMFSRAAITRRLRHV